MARLEKHLHFREASPQKMIHAYQSCVLGLKQKSAIIVPKRVINGDKDPKASLTWNTVSASVQTSMILS